MNEILLGDRLEGLSELIVDGNRLGGIAGEPGWLLERRDLADEGNEFAYRDWPEGARFKASVDEDAYRLRYPAFSKKK